VWRPDSNNSEWRFLNETLKSISLEGSQAFDLSHLVEILRGTQDNSIDLTDDVVEPNIAACPICLETTYNNPVKFVYCGHVHLSSVHTIDKALSLAMAKESLSETLERLALHVLLHLTNVQYVGADRSIILQL
jgi:hypothetical protein